MSTEESNSTLYTTFFYSIKAQPAQAVNSRQRKQLQQLELPEQDVALDKSI